MKILNIKLIIFSVLLISTSPLLANTPHPEPRPHTLEDIQENLYKKQISPETTEKVNEVKPEN